MQKLIILFSFALLVSCNPETKQADAADSSASKPVVVSKEEKVKNAIAFINGYVENANKMNKALTITDWVNSNSLCTAKFKTELKRIIDEANKLDPEMGLEADPILNAQDYPEKGFELDSFDEQTNFLRVKGKDAADFKLTMKVIDENGNWLVDGCGMVNIPEEKR